MSNLIIFRNNYKFLKERLTTGDDLEVRAGNNIISSNCRFVKVTNKGFNIINLDTNRTILKHHVYGLGMTGKDKTYPEIGDITVTVLIPAYLTIIKIEELKTLMQ